MLGGQQHLKFTDVLITYGCIQNYCHNMNAHYCKRGRQGHTSFHVQIETRVSYTSPKTKKLVLKILTQIVTHNSLQHSKFSPQNAIHVQTRLVANRTTRKQKQCGLWFLWSRLVAKSTTGARGKQTVTSKEICETIVNKKTVRTTC